MNKDLKVVCYAAAAFGLLFFSIGFGCLVYDYQTYYSKTESVEGIVTKRITYNEYNNVTDDSITFEFPVFRFNIGGREYVVNDSNFFQYYYYLPEVGEIVRVVYWNDDNPPGESARIAPFFESNDNIFMIIIFCGLGLVFLLLGIIPLIIMAIKNRKKKWLTSYGQSVKAKVILVKQNTNISVNGISPYKVACAWTNPKTKIRHEFKSNYIYYDPQPYIDENKNELWVYYDPHNMKRYYIDVFRKL